MKNYFVFKVFELLSPSLKYTTDELADAKTMTELLHKSDPDHKYVIMQVLD